MNNLLPVLALPMSLAVVVGKPNVILINADDLGYGDLSCYGATKVKTPNIDLLAQEGMRFNDAHSPSAVCSPSRYGLMTGQYPIRKNFWGPTPFTQELTIDLKQPTLASVLKSAGYATSVIGKWHLGFGKGKTDWNEPLKPGPLEVGFEYYFGMPTVNSGPPYVYVENYRVVDYDPEDPFVMGKQSVTQKWPEKGGYGAIGGAKKAHLSYRDEYVGTTFAEKAVKWITSHHKNEKKKQPFFLYLATTNIHHPFTPHPKFKGTSECGLYGDFIHELDWIVGEVLKALDEHKISNNTLVVFTSDNGGMLNVTGQKAWKAGHRLNGKLLGFKFGAWEGGHRVPFLARWPGKIPAGTESDALISQIDLLPTFAAAAGTKLPENAVIDGVNQLPVLTGKSKDSKRELLVISPNSPKHLTIRKGNWVYIPEQDEGGFQGKDIGNHLLAGAAAQKLTQLVNSDVQDGKVKEDAPPAQLYDLKTDPYQANNIYNERPEVVAELSSLLEKWKKTIPASPRLGWINLRQGAQPSPKKGKGKSNPAPKIPAEASKRSVSLDFESGKLEPWKIIKGKFGHPIGNRTHFFHGKLGYNKQGEHYLTTLEPGPKAKKGSDAQTGIIISPLFIPEGGKMTFRVGGGNGSTTYVALCSEDGKEVATARGINHQVMQKGHWDLSKYAGKKTFIKIVDQSTHGWGHVTADNFQFDGELLKEYAKSSVH
ncbi:MAG: arylsulfatase [Opitutae bacterium]|nr:arylsulfatase [Opitutae bacterium]